MKKLMMIAAAMTIVGGAYAQCSDPVLTDCSLVYDFKASLKSTVGKAASGDCEDLCYRATASKSLKGYLYACEGCDCDAFQLATLTAYEKKSDETFVGVPEWDFLNAIGKKSLDAEGLFVVDFAQGSFTAGGFGSFDSKTGMLKSFSGSIVGSLPAPYCEVACADGTPTVAYLSCDFIEDYEIETVAFGTFSLKYNKSLSAKYAAGTWVPAL
jgi:hypothetical protein